MRVTHRMLAHAVSRNLKHNMLALNKRSSQLSSGRIFDRPSQDPVGAFKVMRISGTGLARNAQYRRNIGEGISWLSTTEEALGGAVSALQRLREISVYTANEVFTAADRAAVAPEVKQLLEYLVGIGNTELAGLYIFGGHRTDEKPYGIAGEQGKMINVWHNPTSGLERGRGEGTGITVQNLVPGNYAVSTARESQAYVEAKIICGPGGQHEEIAMTFSVNGADYTVTANGADAHLPDAIANIINAVNGDPFLVAYITATAVDTNNDGHFDSVRFSSAAVPPESFAVKISPSAEEVFNLNYGGPTVTLVSEYLQGARSGFFGTDQISITNNSTAGLGGSVALEIVEALRYQDLGEDQKQQVGGEYNDRVIRLSARYLLKDVDGNNYEGSYGLRSGEDIYLNLNRLRRENQRIAFMTGGGEIILEINGGGTLTFEQDIPLVGDKAVLQLKPANIYASTGEFERFTLHRDYGRPDARGRPTTGDSLDWYFTEGLWEPQPPAGAKTTVLKFFDIDQAGGNFFTSSMEVTFNYFGTAAADEYREREEILLYGVPDEEYANYPAAIFSFIAAGEAYFTGNSGERLLEIAPGMAVAANLSGLRVFDHTGKDGVGLFRAVNNLYRALINNDRAALGGSALSDLDLYLNNLLRDRSELGARMERFLVTEERNISEQIFLRELRSKIEDIDMAEIITEFTLQESIYQAALATGARMVYPSLVDFLR